METDESKSPNIRKLRLQPLSPKDLPPHPDLKDFQPLNHKVDLRHFIQEVLQEATDFGDSVIPSTFQNKGSPKSSPPSAAKVQLLSSDLIKGESWFARQSLHENAPLDGTASYDEFEDFIFHDHSKYEKEYTPAVYDAHKVLHWSEEISTMEEGGGFGETFQNVFMEIYEMCHQIPGPLDNRSFATLVTRAKTRDEAFVIAQIPVNISKVPKALYSNGRNRTAGETAQQKERVTMGVYVSVERVRAAANDKIMWEMATASDAKGFLPMALQKMGVPGAVVKDVGLFIGWTCQRRREEGDALVDGAEDVTTGTTTEVPANP